MKFEIKSVLAGMLSLCLLTCQASAMSFPDVPKDSDYAEAIEYVSELNLMVGDNQGNFNPNNVVSRAEMAAIICRMLGRTENLAASNVFDDVSAAHWANACVGFAAELGIVAGYGNGKFGPSDTVTYEQAITMVVRAIGQSETANSLGGYPDGFIQAAKEGSLLEGINEVQGQGLSRGAVAMLLRNYYLWTPSKPNDGHDHYYDDKTMPGSGTDGHYEDVQVQVGTKTVEDRKPMTTYHCGVCDLTTTDYDVIQRHTNPKYEEAKPENGGHWGARTWTETKKVAVTHEEPVYETRTIWVSDSAITIRVCTLCGQMEPPAPSDVHTHRFIEKTIPASGTGGHYEDVQVQAGTKTVNDYEDVTIYGCGACSFTTYNYSELKAHCPADLSSGAPHAGCRTWSETKKVVVGTHEEPEYWTETRWVEDSATTIRVCEICGAEEQE